jgi:Ca2+-dependent lipid-binding protein
MNEQRRIFDFIMGCCAGYLFFYGTFLGYSVGVLMVGTHIILVYRERMLKALDKSIKEDEKR